MPLENNERPKRSRRKRNAAASFDTRAEAVGRAGQRAAIKQALAHEGRLPAQAPAGAGVGLPGGLWIASAVLAGALLALLATLLASAWPLLKLSRARPAHLLRTFSHED